MGREHIYNVKDVNELVRLYDGADNPVGKCYSKHEFCETLLPYFNGDVPAFLPRTHPAIQVGSSAAPMA